MADPPSDISVVIPTYNRAGALRLNLPYVLALGGVGEVVVVIDASTDDSDQVLASFGDARLRVLRHAHRQGSQAARKTGVAAAEGQWLIMLDDDCATPPDFAQILLDTALTCNADVVAAPWLHLEPGDDPEAALARARAAPSTWIGLNTSPSVFPDRDLVTPFLPGNVLINRRVFDRVTYDEGLTRNAWREETSFYLDASAAGFTCVLTPRTASFQLDQWSGGQRLPRLQYESFVLRNNWRFLRRHADSLRGWGEIRHPVTAQVGFALHRVTGVVKGYLRARLGDH